MTSILTFEQRKRAFSTLGHYLAEPDETLRLLINSAHYTNAWFTPAEVQRAVLGISTMLNERDLEKWLDFNLSEKSSKIIGLVLAGNIPLVGFHDILAVLATGNTALIKLSSQDNKLIPHILERLVKIEPDFAKHIRYTEKLEGFDAVIATGSNNTSRYFEHYFGRFPHIIRKNRNSIAVLSGSENEDELKLLGNDIFDYFGLGCRNVSKLFVPENYDFKPFFEAIEAFQPVINHHKYSNNYDYNKSIYLVNGDKHLDNGFLLVKEDERLASPLSVIFYETYHDSSFIEQRLQHDSSLIQCIVSGLDLNVTNQLVRFGQSQSPRLWDYADGINTLDFLLSLE